MQDKNDLQEFELDDLISEFQDPSEVSDDAGELTGELADLLGDWGTEETAVPMDTIRILQKNPLPPLPWIPFG